MLTLEQEAVSLRAQRLVQMRAVFRAWSSVSAPSRRAASRSRNQQAGEGSSSSSSSGDSEEDDDAAGSRGNEEEEEERAGGPENHIGSRAGKAAVRRTGGRVGDVPDKRNMSSLFS